MDWFKQTQKLVGLILLLAGISFGQQDANANPAPQQGSTAAAAPTQTLNTPLEEKADAPAVTPALVPDTQPLSGVLGLTLGRLKGARDTVTLNMNVGQMFDSNSAVSGSQSDYQWATALGANLSLRHAMRRGDLSLDYQAGVIVYSGQVRSQNNWFPQLNFSVPFALRRWTVVLAENLTYTPQGSFGAQLGLANFGASLSQGINSTFIPQQSVYTPVSGRLSNTSAVQVQYGFSPRSSWTASLSYGSLYFPDGDLENTHQINVRTGYNRSLTAKDTVSVSYDYATYQASGQVSNTDTHAVQLGYARRVTGRLSWSVSGGPQFVSQQARSNNRITSWTAASTALYQLRKTSANVSYLHGVTGGAGVFEGATTDTLGAGVSQSLSRNLSIGVSGQLAKTVDLASNSEFRSGFAGIQVHRLIGHRASVYFSYGFQRQLSDGSCVGTLCSALSRQVFGFGFSWGPRPWVIR